MQDSTQAKDLDTTMSLRLEYRAHDSLDWRKEPPIKRSQTEYQFTVATDQGTVRLDVAPHCNTITATLSARLSTAGIHSLSEWRTTHRIPSGFHPDVRPLIDAADDAVERLISILRFTYPMDCLRGASKYKLSHSADGVNWEEEKLPSKGYRAGIMFTNHIDETSAPLIQHQLDAEVKPLLAFRHLQHAEDGHETRHMWIEATIAAELGIKEFLARYKPDLQHLLLELPSPPLPKLYGAILEAYTGKRSPWMKQIAHGVEIRNRLVHRPDHFVPDRQDTWDYILAVKAALHDLVAQLYPKELSALATYVAGFVRQPKK